VTSGRCERLLDLLVEGGGSVSVLLQLLSVGWVVSFVLSSMEPKRAVGSSSNVTDLLGCLKLTEEESSALSVDDASLDNLVTSYLAIIDKVLSPKPLHIQTIMSALRPAWGNLKGLDVKSVRDNIFIVEFSSKSDLERVMDGPPWNVGNKAVLVQHFDPSLRPSEVMFDRMAI
jgi:hypothetical protein